MSPTAKSMSSKLFPSTNMFPSNLKLHKLFTSIMDETLLSPVIIIPPSFVDGETLKILSLTSINVISSTPHAPVDFLILIVLAPLIALVAIFVLFIARNLIIPYTRFKSIYSALRANSNPLKISPLGCYRVGRNILI